MRQRHSYVRVGTRAFVPCTKYPRTLNTHSRAISIHIYTRCSVADSTYSRGCIYGSEKPVENHSPLFHSRLVFLAPKKVLETLGKTVLFNVLMPYFLEIFLNFVSVIIFYVNGFKAFKIYFTLKCSNKVSNSIIKSIVIIYEMSVRVYEFFLLNVRW